MMYAVLGTFCFISFSAILWIALRRGSAWATQRQKDTASTAADSLESMFIFTDVNRLLLINISVMLALPLITWLLTSNLIMVGLSMVAAFMIPKRIVAYLKKRRLNRFEQQLPDALLMISGALRAGASLPIAIESLVSDSKPPISQEFDLLLRELRLGLDFGVALQNLDNRVPIQDLHMVTAGMSLARDVGANLAETLDSISKTLRSKLQMEGKIKSLTAQGKMQGWVMASLPFCLILILRAMEPEAMKPLFSEWYGWLTFAVIIVMDLIGYHFIKKITSIDV